MSHPLPKVKYDGITRNGVELTEERGAIYLQAFGRCQTCGKPCPFDHGQVAHRICNSKAMRKKYGARVIDSIQNKAWTHPGRCNDAQNIAGNPDKCAEIVAAVEGES